MSLFDYSTLRNELVEIALPQGLRARFESSQYQDSKVLILECNAKDKVLLIQVWNRDGRALSHMHEGYVALCSSVQAG
jgi:hypothetical protein